MPMLLVKGRVVMERKQWFSLVAGVTVVSMGLGISSRIKPVEAGVQTVAPIERPVLITIQPAASHTILKAHWGIYALSEYDYAFNGKMTVVKKNDLIVEEDMPTGNGGGRASVKLKSGEYEIHVQPDKSRQIVKRFIVNNLGTAIIPLNFNMSPIADPDELRKIEYVHLGPPLSELEERISVLEKKNGIASSPEK